MKFILASQSSRRKQILEDMGFKDFDIVVSDAIEVFDNILDVRLQIEQVAKTKVLNVWSKIQEKYLNDDICIIGADTIVWKDNHIIGKPKNKKEAFTILSSLSNCMHEVITGLCVLAKVNNNVVIASGSEVSQVVFCKLSNQIINSYLESEAYMDKAGGYSIYNKNFKFVHSIIGNQSNVAGLSKNLLRKILKDLQIKIE